MDTLVSMKQSQGAAAIDRAGFQAIWPFGLKIVLCRGSVRAGALSALGVGGSGAEGDVWKAVRARAR